MNYNFPGSITGNLNKLIGFDDCSFCKATGQKTFLFDKIIYLLK